MIDDTTGAVTVTGYTVVHRESEWDDDARAAAMDLIEHEAGECPCGCGLRAEATLNPEQVWDVQRYTCRATRARMQVERQWEKQNEKSPDGWADGVRHYVVPVDDPRPPEVRERLKRKTRGSEEVTPGD